MTKPNCYECKHRSDLAGNAHSQCDVGVASLFNGCKSIPQAQGDAHGIANGWFFWPFNYDPIWLNSCDSFEVKQ